MIARIYEVHPLLCPKCGGQMRLIAFIIEGVQIRRILDHIGFDSEPPHIAWRAGHRRGRTVVMLIVLAVLLPIIVLNQLAR